MKQTFILLTCMLLLASVLLLNVHIIRTDYGTDMIMKKNMTFQDTYVDARKWSLADYLSHGSRIRNYLICEKHYPRLLRQTRQRAGASADAAKDALRSAEISVRKWISEKFE
ncbi:MAG: hypothetical protein DRI57_30100 [Deltaproteobacteria bacterium]|nr:MAG: hypothetical protein DRI57_30100 [Deltaproteobacteria bacterium]